MAVNGHRINNWTVNVLIAALPAVPAVLLVEFTVRIVVGAGHIDHWAGYAGISFAMAAFFGLLAFRVLQRGVIVSEAGCTGQWVFWKKRTAWRDVERFSMYTEERRGDRDLTPYKVLLERFDGHKSQLPLGAFSPDTASRTASWLNEQRRILDRSKA